MIGQWTQLIGKNSRIQATLAASAAGARTALFVLKPTLPHWEMYV